MIQRKNVDIFLNKTGGLLIAVLFILSSMIPAVGSQLDTDTIFNINDSSEENYIGNEETIKDNKIETENDINIWTGFNSVLNKVLGFISDLNKDEIVDPDVIIHNEDNLFSLMNKDDPWWNT